VESFPKSFSEQETNAIQWQLLIPNDPPSMTESSCPLISGRRPHLLGSLRVNTLPFPGFSLSEALPQSSFMIMIQEPYLYKGNVCGLDKWNLHFTRDINARTAIFTHQPVTFHANLSGRDCTTCSMIMGGTLVYFSSVYLDINSTVQEPNWVKTLHKAQADQAHQFTAVDSNIHSVL
jgi:hypothetical protein